MKNNNTLVNTNWKDSSFSELISIFGLRIFMQIRIFMEHNYSGCNTYLCIAFTVALIYQSISSSILNFAIFSYDYEYLITKMKCGNDEGEPFVVR